MMNIDLAGIRQLAQEQGIEEDVLKAALEEALRMAYLKNPHASQHVRVELDPRAETFTVWARKEIPQESTEDNPHPEPVLGEEFDDTPEDFGRQAAAAARQALHQLFRQAEDERILGAFANKKGKLITGIIQQDDRDSRNIHVKVGDVEALLPLREQVPGESYRHGERLRVYVVSVNRGLRGPEIIVSRSHPELVKQLFEREVPELTSGAVSVMGLAREGGARTKIAVKSNVENVNPKGALIGTGGARVRAVMDNLDGEKIDIVDYSEDPAAFIAAALSPARVDSVEILNKDQMTAIAYVPESQLSLAIGKEGKNARLAAKLTGWRIGIESLELHQQRQNAAAQGKEIDLSPDEQGRQTVSEVRAIKPENEK